MMKGIWVIACVLAAVGAQAIVWRADRPQARLAPLSTSVDDSVGVIAHSGARTDSGSAVLIGDDVILTAGHMLPPPGTTTVFRLNGETFETTAWTLHPSFRKPGAAFDLAMARLTRRVTSTESSPLLGANPTSRQPVKIVGCGGSGPVGSPLQWTWQPFAGTNLVASVDRNFVRTTFDRPGRAATELEAHLVPGDSGGGLFVQGPNGWALAGIASTRSGASYGARSTFINVQSALAWVRSTGFGFGRAEVRLELNDWQRDGRGISARWSLEDPASGLVVESGEAGLTPSGGFSFRTAARGQFRLRVWPPGWTPETLESLTLSNEATTASVLTLRNGDANRDGTVTLEDAFAVQAAWDAVPGAPHWNASADLNGDDRVDAADLQIIQSRL